MKSSASELGLKLCIVVVRDWRLPFAQIRPNYRENLELVSKMRFDEMEHHFPFGNSVWEFWSTLVLPINKTKQTNKLYLTRVTLNSEITDKPVALGFQIELEFGNVGF